MSTSYAQKQASAQKKDAPTAASVLDSSSQSESLQRKADLCNSPIQCYGMTPWFRQNHSSCKKDEAIRRCLNRGHVNSVLTKNAQKRLNGANANATRIVGVPCATWGYNYGNPRKIENANRCTVIISEGNMDHLDENMRNGTNYKDLH